MFQIATPLTDAPNVNTFQSPFEKGFNAGFEQRSDIIKRLQTRRSQDQTDWELRQRDRQISVDIWKTQVQASLAQQEMAQQNAQANQRFALEAQGQAIQLQQQSQLLPLTVQAKALEIQKSGLEIEQTRQEMDAFGSGNEVISMLGKAAAQAITFGSGNFGVQQQQQQAARRPDPNQIVKESNAQNAPTLSKFNQRPGGGTDWGLPPQTF